MKPLLLLPGILLLLSSAAAQSGATAERQALARQLTHLLHDPANPTQEVELHLVGCHVQQIFRDTDADVQLAQPVNVRVNRGSSDWAVRMDNGRFELQLGFDWSDVTSLSYVPQTQAGRRSYELRVERQSKNRRTTTEMTLHTSDEAVVRDVVRRLEKVRASCH